VIRIKRAQVSIWKEKDWSLRAKKSMRMFDFDLIGRAKYLQDWWIERGQNEDFKPISMAIPIRPHLRSFNWRTVSRVKSRSFYAVVSEIPIVQGRPFYRCSCSKMECVRE
jgi:hypothetical protein